MAISRPAERARTAARGPVPLPATALIPAVVAIRDRVLLTRLVPGTGQG